MRINSTFQLMDEIAKIIAGPRPKVISNQTRVSRDHIKNFFELSPLAGNYKRIPEDPVNFIQFPIEGVPTYPLKAITILTGFEPIIRKNNIEELTACFIHPYLSIDSKQAIFLANHFLRTSFELDGLKELNADNIDLVHPSYYKSIIGTPEYLLTITTRALKYLYYYLLNETKEIGIFQDSNTFDNLIITDFNADHDMVSLSNVELLNTFVLDAMVNSTIRKIYNLIVTSMDKSIIVDKQIAFDKLFNSIYIQNFTHPTQSKISESFELYKKYNIIVHSLVDSFMNAQPDYNIDMWVHMICMAYEEYEDKK